MNCEVASVDDGKEIEMGTAVVSNEKSEYRPTEIERKKKDEKSRVHDLKVNNNLKNI